MKRLLITFVSLLVLVSPFYAAISPQATAKETELIEHPKSNVEASRQIEWIWSTETVDSSGFVGEWTSLAVDSFDHPHISYYHRSSQDLRYAYHDGSSWQIGTVDSGGDVGLGTSLAIDTNNHPHIAYWDTTNTALKYAQFNGVSWISETVDSEGTVGPEPSLALDLQNYPHISYNDWGNSSLKYAYFDGTSWYSETVDNLGDVGGSSSIALDQNDYAHISYHDSTNGAIKYAYYDGFTWQIEWVDGYSSSRSVAEPSIVLDQNSYPHISYYDQGNGNLDYAWFDGTMWYTETVDSTGDVGNYSSLALDTFGFPQISYSDETNHDLLYAYYDSSGWYTTTVEAVGLVGRFTSLVLAADNTPHISYFASGSATNLKYAVGCINAYADFTWVPAFPLIDEVVTFTASILTRTQVLTYSWSFGDGFYDVGQVVTHTYTVGGFYSVTLTATNDCGQDVVINVVQVLSECNPVDEVNITGPTTLLPGETGLFTATYTPITATPPIVFAWDNGATSPTTTYSWADPGIYTLTVMATNPCGQAGDYMTVTVTSLPCDPVEIVLVSGPAILLTNETGLYTATYTPPTATLPVTLTWDNGASGPTAAYSWTIPGAYTITVTATNDCGQAVDHLTVTVIAPPCDPIEMVSVSGPVTLLTNEPGFYTATYAPPTATLPVTLAWDNGASGPTAAYSWTMPGIYAITVTATNDCGQVTDTLVVTVTEPCIPVTEVVVGGPAVLRVGEEGLYAASYLPPQATMPVLALWDNGAGGELAVYSWTIPGIYTVTVTATNPCGQATGNLTVTVTWWQVHLPLVFYMHDAYEPDNTWQQASPLAVGEEQRHSLDPDGDQDWLVFQAASGSTYEIVVFDPGAALDSYLELFDQDGESLIIENDDCSDPQYASCLSFTPTADGSYFIRVSDYDWAGGPSGYEYTIRLGTLP